MLIRVVECTWAVDETNHEQPSLNINKAFVAVYLIQNVVVIIIFIVKRRTSEKEKKSLRGA